MFARPDSRREFAPTKTRTRRWALCSALPAALALIWAGTPAVADDAPAEGHEANPPYMSTSQLVKLDRADRNVLRSGPGETFSMVEVAPKGARYPILAKRGPWFNVRLSDTRTAWIHESLCSDVYDMSGLEFRPNPRMFSRIGSYTLTGWGGGYSFDRKSNTPTVGGRVGYYALDWLEVEGGLAWTKVNRPAEIVESLFALRLEAEEFHMLFYEMNGNLKILPGRQLVPYLTAGVGSSIMRGESEPTFNYGGGILFFVAKRTAMRWEFRTYDFDSGSDNARRSNSNYVFTVGTTFLL